MKKRDFGILLLLAAVAVLIFSDENEGSLRQTWVHFKDSSPPKHEGERLQPPVVAFDDKLQELIDPQALDHPSTSRRLLSQKGRRLNARGGGGRAPGRGGRDRGGDRDEDTRWDRGRGNSWEGDTGGGGGSGGDGICIGYCPGGGNRGGGDGGGGSTPSATTQSTTTPALASSTSTSNSAATKPKSGTARCCSIVAEDFNKKSRNPALGRSSSSSDSSMKLLKTLQQVRNKDDLILVRHQK